MSSLYLWIPKDFDKRYEKYRGKFSEDKMPEPFLIDKLASEKENLLLINNKAEYESEMEKWKPLKMVVDAIYKELSPFEKKSQSVKIDISKLDISGNMASSVLMMLVYERVCRWRIDSNPVVMTSASIREYLKGDGVIVQDYENFRNFRKEITDFYNFIEQKKIEKFPEIKPPKLNDNFPSNIKYQKEAIKNILNEGLKEEALTEKILKKVDEKMQKGKKTSFSELYLNRVGDLWREPKTKYCYPMGEKSDRHRIVRYLAINKGYQQTSAISSALDQKNEQSLRKEIGKINENFKEFLQIAKDKLIESKKGSGYRMNQKYKIHQKQ